MEFEAMKITSDVFAISKLLVRLKGGKIRIMGISRGEYD